MMEGKARGKALCVCGWVSESLRDNHLGWGGVMPRAGRESQSGESTPIGAMFFIRRVGANLVAKMPGGRLGGAHPWCGPQKESPLPVSDEFATRYSLYFKAPSPCPTTTDVRL